LHTSLTETPPLPGLAQWACYKGLSVWVQSRLDPKDDDDDLDVLSGANHGNQSRDVIISSCSLPLIVDEPPIWEIPHGRDHESTDEADWLPAGQGRKYSAQEEMGKNWMLHLVWFLFIAFLRGRVPLWNACRHLFFMSTGLMLPVTHKTKYCRKQKIGTKIALVIWSFRINFDVRSEDHMCQLCRSAEWCPGDNLGTMTGLSLMTVMHYMVHSWTRISCGYVSLFSFCFFPVLFHLVITALSSSSTKWLNWVLEW